MRKQFSALALVFLMLLVTLLGTSCGIKELKIEKNPQLVFVKGNELDLSAGTLSADGKTVALNAEGVEVSGYNKDQLGEQKLTVTYKKKTVELTVTVVPRIQASESYVYFVGESIDAVGLRLRVTKDDGTYISMSGDDANVTVSGFSSETPNDALELNVTCRDGGVDYSGSITVSVVTPGVTFKKPRKLEYGSHETELDMTGISLALKNADGKTVRNINNNDLTLEGFDPAAATADKQSVTETIRVFFGGREMASFDVTVNYSNVSRIRDSAKVFRTLDWSHYERPESGMYLPAGATDEMGKDAMATLERYYNLTDKDAALISQNELDATARLAVIYGYNQWTAAINRAYENVFRMDLGEITYTCVKLADAKAGLEKLRAASDDDTKLILSYGSILKNAKLTEKCGETVIYDGAEEDGVKVELGIGHLLTIIYDSGYFTNKVANVLDKMISLPDILNVPANWTADSLDSYKDAIETAYGKILEISLSDAEEIGVFEIVNNWRDQKDFFEILYRYFFREYQAADKTVSETASGKIDKLTELFLPGKLQDIYHIVVLAEVWRETMADNKSQYSGMENGYPALMESTYFFNAYRQLVRESNALTDLNDPMYNELYNRKIAKWALTLQWGDCGYYDLLSSSGLDSACVNVLEQYLDIWEAVQKDLSYMNSADFGTGVSAMFRAFVGLEPNQQYNLLGAINYLYSENRMPTMALYPNDGALFSEFATYIYAYYLELLGVDLSKDNENNPAYNTFTDLMIALECYANGDWTNFGSYMAKAQEAYALVTGDTKTVFDANLSFLYTDCNEKFSRFELTTDADGKQTYVYKAVDLGSFEATFEKLSNELSRVQLAKFFIEDLAKLTGTSVDLYLEYIASYERVRYYVEDILTNGSEEIRLAFRMQPYGDDGAPLYRAYYDARGYYQLYLLMLNVGEDVYDNENTVDLRAFLREYADYFWRSASQMYQVPDGLDKDFELSVESLKKMMADFRQLSGDEKYLLYGLDSLQLYYGGIVTYLTNTYGEKSPVPGLAYTLMLVEVYHYTYESNPDKTFTMKDGTVKTAKELLLEAWNLFYTEGDDCYALLSASDKAIFDTYFAEMMDYYRTVCEALQDEA